MPGANVSAAQQSAAARTGQGFTFGIPNAKGGFTQITLEKFGKGYLGPQGEFYPGFPKLELLKAIYGE